MRKIKLNIFLIIILLIISIGSFIIKKNFTGYSIKEYSFTKAFCNKTNYCEDYKIICNKNKLIKLIPTGNAIQFSQDWKDLRTKENNNSLCDYRN